MHQGGDDPVAEAPLLSGRDPALAQPTEKPGTRLARRARSNRLCARREGGTRFQRLWTLCACSSKPAARVGCARSLAGAVAGEDRARLEVSGAPERCLVHLREA